MTVEEFKVQCALGTLSKNKLYSMASNKSTNKKILDILSRNKDIYIRIEVGNNSNTSKETLKTLSKDKTESVRWYVSRNPNVPRKALKEMVLSEGTKIWFDS